MGAKSRLIPAISSVRGFGTFKYEWDAKEMPVNQYVSDSKGSKPNRMYAWGLAASGALGSHEFMKPKGHPRPLRKCFVPCLIPFGAFHKVHKVACGYGF